MKYKIVSVEKIKISKKGLSFLDVTMFVRNINDSEDVEPQKMTKTFTRREWERVDKNGEFED